MHPPRSGRRSVATWSAHLVLAAVAYIPLLLTAPGRVGADTKAYLYLDPVRWLSVSASMWDPDLATGSVTHEYIGYLLPMGPYYALMHVLGVPTWVAQRLWTGSLLFLAGAGVLYLLRTLSPATGERGTGSLDMATLGGLGAMVGALAYMLSPYVVQYEARESVLLLPWVGLPWMLATIARALRVGGWRYPAFFALVVALVGSTNAASLIFVGVGPVLWVVWELVTGRVRWGRALSTALKVTVLSLAACAWWIVGLSVEGAYLGNILRDTESIPTVARTSLASETVRGLGYWFFYGVDKLGLYLPTAGPYMTSLWLLAVSFAVPAFAFLTAFLVRWRERAYFVALILVGTILAVSVHPLSDPSPLGRVIKASSSDSTAGLALRSTNRATPLVILGIAVLLGAGVAALARRWKVAGAISAVAVMGLVAADLPALWTGQFVTTSWSRPEQVPSYWTDAAKFLDDQPGAAQTRVLTEPGIDFATYRWGSTLDPVLPGLMTRPEVDRGLVPYGSTGASNLLTALDEQVQEGTVDPSALAPTARIMSAGDLVVQSDLVYEHYDTPRPRALWQTLTPTPSGLSAPVAFGNPAVTAAPPVKYPLIDETELGLPHGAPYPPPVAVFPVPDARPILRAESASHPLLVDGDGSGLVAAAGAGLLDAQATVLYSPSFAANPAGLQRTLSQRADLVVTDSNRKRAEQVGTVRDNFGYTEMAGEKALVPDDRDVRTSPFPAPAGTASQTVALEEGVKSVEASGYGNSITYTPENRPDQAMDGNLRTAWTVAAFDNPLGQYLRITLAHPVATGQVNLVQPLYGPRNRWITGVTLRFDGGHAVTEKLGATSRTAAGQTITFPSRSFTTLQITIDATNTGTLVSFGGQSGVGFAEVRVAGQQVHEVIRMPEDLLTAAGPSSASHRLTLLMTRDRVAPVPPRTDPEVDIARSFTLPTARTFSVSGTAELSPLVPDDVIDKLLGTTVPGVLAAYSSGRLPGDLQDRASSTLDGSLATVWSPGLGPQAGNWLEYNVAKPITFDHLSMAIVTDGKHSVPTSVTISADGTTRTVGVPALADSSTPWTTQIVNISFPALTGSRLRVTFDTVRPVTDLDQFSNKPIDLPLGIAEVSIPGVADSRTAPASLPGTCRSDLLTVDGKQVPVSITGTTQSAASLGLLQVRGCGSAADGITLGAGAHELQTQPGVSPGVDVDIDSLVLDSAAGGGPLAPAASGRAEPTDSGPAPEVSVVHFSTTSAQVVVHEPTAPFWMVLGESTNAGWHAVVGGKDLGASQLIDGYANGWLVTPTSPGHDMVITLTWTPQRFVDEAIVVTGVTLAFCLVLACWPRRARRRRRQAAVQPVSVPAGPPSGRAAVRIAALWSARSSPVTSTPDAKPGAVSTAVSPSGDWGVGEQAPVLGSPLRSTGTRPHWLWVLLVSALAGGVTSAVVAPAAGIPVGVATFVGLAFSYGRVLLAIGSVGLLVAVDDMVTAGQSKFHYLAEFGWPTHFETASTLAWLAVCALAADALVQEVRQRRARRDIAPHDAQNAPVARRRTGRMHTRAKHSRRM